MSLEQALRLHWSLEPDLTSLVPLSQFWTGVAPPAAERPFVVLATPQIETKLRASGGRKIEEATVRMTVVARTLGEAHRVAKQIERTYEGETLPLDDGSVLDIASTRREQQPTTDNQWELAINFRALIERVKAE